MSYETEKLELRRLRMRCGLSISELARITTSSRSTLYSLENGEAVRRSTVINILKNMRNAEACAASHSEIDLELRRLGVAASTESRADQLLADLGVMEERVTRFAEYGMSGPLVTDIELLKTRAGKLQEALDSLVAQQEFLAKVRSR